MRTTFPTAKKLPGPAFAPSQNRDASLAVLADDGSGQIIPPSCKSHPATQYREPYCVTSVITIS